MLLFKKISASGNDFIVIDERKSPNNWTKKEVEKLCDRKFGVGADQLLLIRPSHIADVSMVVYNMDGSKAEQCGNGLCAIAAYLLKDTQLGLSKVKIQSGFYQVHEVHMLNGDSFMVQMGWPILIQKELNFAEMTNIFSPLHIKTGNPHLVLWTHCLESINLELINDASQAYFSEQVNIHVLQKITNREVRIRHWERGVGQTLSCGSGTVASIFAGHHLGFLERNVLIRSLHDELFVEQRKEGYYLTGRVYIIFDGCLRMKL
jgi:diaminopimelate epimerase